MRRHCMLEMAPMHGRKGQRYWLPPTVGEPPASS